MGCLCVTKSHSRWRTGEYNVKFIDNFVQYRIAIGVAVTGHPTYTIFKKLKERGIPSITVHQMNLKDIMIYQQLIDEKIIYG